MILTVITSGKHAAKVVYLQFDNKTHKARCQDPKTKLNYNSKQ